MTKQDVKKYLSSIGKKGGLAGKGESKRRGPPEYYAKLAKKKKQSAKK
jgi:hypothetical protein